MPPGNPAGYLPIPKRFKSRGSKRGGVPVRPYIPKPPRNKTGGAMAPNRLAGPQRPKRPKAYARVPR